MADFRDRVKELRRVPASQIVPNAHNPRIHPDGQREAWRKMTEAGRVPVKA